MKRFIDYLESCRQRLPHFLFEYINTGSYDEITMRGNISRLSEITLHQRAMRDVSKISTRTQLLGAQLSLPAVLGPVGLAGMMARRGEVQAARAAARLGIPYCMSTYSICSIEEVARAVDRSFSFWFQLNLFTDRGLVIELLQHAAEHCLALVFNCDLMVLGTRYSDFRTGLVAPGLRGKLRRVAQAASRPGWSWNVGVRGRPHALGNIQPYLDAQQIAEDCSSWTKRHLDPSNTWKDVSWIRDRWKGPLIIKGVLDPEDAATAINLGADAIVVSNHGGRQLDSVLSTVDALPPIVDRLAGRGTIFVDGGVRSGIDILKMMSLGANGVFLGRAWVNALAAQGEDGIVEFLENMGSELRIGMAMTGVDNVADIHSSPSIRKGAPGSPSGAIHRERPRRVEI